MIKAVIFDMFETLVTHYRSSLYFGEDIARDLNLPEERFREIWDCTEVDRSIGKLTFEQTIRQIMEQNGIDSEEAFKNVTEKRLHAKRELFNHLDVEIVTTLKELKERKIRLGLISNCFSEEAVVIRESILYPFFDAAFLSYEQGIMKPDQEIYVRCMRRLDVEPAECLYVGDGGSRELETAAELGMKTLQATWYFKENHRTHLGYLQQFQQLSHPLEILDDL